MLAFCYRRSELFSFVSLQWRVDDGITTGFGSINRGITLEYHLT